MYERHVHHVLDAPVLVVGMEGWIDAGLGAAAAMAAVLNQANTDLLATFDADRLLDQRARRPVVRIENGVNTGLTWPEIQMRAGKDRLGSDVVFLVGPEPDVQWRAFTSSVVTLATELNVRLVVGLGAFPAPVPHTRPTRLAATATTPELAAEVGFVSGTIDVPAGIAAAIERGFADAAIPAVGLWARVPHYAAAMPFPAASVALIEGMAKVAALEFDATDLRTAAVHNKSQLDDLIANSEEHTAMVRQLEEQIDAAEGAQADLDLSRLPSGDEIAAELERFLRGDRGPE